jgi:hypothetical protein
MIIDHWNGVESHGHESGCGFIDRQILWSTHRIHALFMQPCRRRIEQQPGHLFVVDALKLAEETNSIVPMPVVVVVDKGVAAADNLVTLQGKEKSHVRMFKKKILGFKKTGHADQLVAKIFEIEQRHVLRILAIVAPMKIDEPFQPFAIIRLIGKRLNPGLHNVSFA